VSCHAVGGICTRTRADGRGSCEGLGKNPRSGQELRENLRPPHAGRERVVTKALKSGARDTGFDLALGHAVTTTRRLPLPQSLRYIQPSAPEIIVDHVSFAFDDHIVLRDISFSVPRGSVRFLFGASGSGKSVLLKLVAGLLKPDAGAIVVNGQRIDTMSERELMATRSDIGMVFQENALFDSLTVGDNVGYRLYEETDTPEEQVRARVDELLRFVGLAEFCDRLPSELSGGERRRVAIARAMVSSPRVLLCDDPTTGLDPITSMTIDNEIVKLRDLRQVTSVVATHQVRDAFYIATHHATQEADHIQIAKADATFADRAEFMVLHEGRIHFEGTADELLASRDAYLQHFLRMTLPPW
jgi:phospholipid/cholesterol/gamma-HCH transport system ATP-binding protein